MLRYILLLVGCFGFTHAQTLNYRVEDASLTEVVNDALAQWQAVEGGNVEAEVSEVADTVFALADTALLGPDVTSLTVLERDNTGEQQTRILLPQASDNRIQASLHEWGRLLDIPLAQSGIMNPAIDVASPIRTLSAGDTNALQEAGRYVREDINRDGQVDFYDLLELAANYSREGARLAGDLNEDGLVNQQDIEILEAAYQFSPPSQTPPTSSSDNAASEIVPEEDFPDLTPLDVDPSEVFPEPKEDDPAEAPQEPKTDTGTFGEDIDIQEPALPDIP